MARWRVREIAEPERWNVKKLSEATGLAYGSVYAIWTNQATRADLKTMAAIARVLKVQPGDLIEAEEEDVLELPANEGRPALKAA